MADEQPQQIVPNPNEQITVVNSMGKVFAVTPEGAKQALQSGSWRLESPEERTHRLAETQFSDRPIAAGAAGLARGATLGLSDVVLAESGAVSPETLKGLKEFNPGISVASDVAGMIVPSILSGGSGTVAKGASMLPSSLVSKLSASTAKEVAERTALSLAKTGLKPAAQNIVKKMAALGLAGSVEGAIYGAGQQVSEQALDAPPGFIAESLMSEEGISKILKGAAKGAAFGGGIGAGIGGISGAVAPVTAAAAKKLSNLTEGWLSKERFAVKALGPYKRQLKDVGRFAKYSDEAIDNALESGKTAYLDRNLMGVKELGTDLIEEGVVPKNFTGTTIEQSRDIAQAKVREWGETIGDILSGADDIASATGKSLDVDGLKKNIYSNVINPLMKKKLPEFTKVGQRLSEMVEGRIGPEITNLQSLHSMRRDLDELLFASRRDPTATLYNRNLFKMRSTVENFIENGIDDLAKGTELQGTYQQAKRKFASMKWAQETAENRIVQEGANRFLSPSDQGWAAIFGGGSAMVRGGIDPASVAMGLFAGLTNRVLRKRGASIAAGTLANLNNLGSLNSLGMKVSGKIENAVRTFLEASPTSFVSPASIKAGLIASDEKKSSGGMEIDNLVRLANQNSGYESHIENYIGSLGHVAPQTAFELSSNLANAIKFLQDKAPKSLESHSTIFTPYNSQASDLEKAKWDRYKSVINNPLQALADGSKDNITPEYIETIKAVYPNLFEKIKQTVLDEMGKKKDASIPYQKRLQVSYLFDIPLDPSLEAQTIGRLQANFKKSAAPEAGMGHPMGGGSSGAPPAGIVLSNIQRAEAR